MQGNQKVWLSHRKKDLTETVHAEALWDPQCPALIMLSELKASADAALRAA